MALSSKNNSEEIDKILKREKIDELFFIKKINYGRKSISIKNISEESGIAMTEMLFVDDDEYERFEVKHTINEIICVSPKEFWNNYYDEIIRKNEITTDSKTRRLYYLEEKKYRTEVKRKGYDEVFDTLNSVIYCRNKNNDDISRIDELKKRTHRLNSSGYTSKNNLKECVIEYEDAFYPKGIVGYVSANIEKNALLLSQICISCRVLSRRIEKEIVQAVLIYYLGQDTRIEEIKVLFNESDRNGLLVLAFKALGLKRQGNMFRANVKSIRNNKTTKNIKLAMGGKNGK